MRPLRPRPQRIRRLRPKRLISAAAAREVIADSESEAAMQRRLREQATQVTPLYFHDVDSRRNDIGFPDTFIGLPKQNLLLVPELKSAAELVLFYKLLQQVEVDPSHLVRNRKALKSHRQRLWIEFLNRQPAIVAAVVGPRDLPGMLQYLVQELQARA